MITLVLQYGLTVALSVQVQPYIPHQLDMVRYPQDTLASTMVLMNVGIIPEEHTINQNAVLWREL